MKDTIVKPPVLFFDDWPQQAKSKEDEEFEKDPAGLTEVKKWRLQTLLAVNPWGIPLLALKEAYKTMFDRELDPSELGFEHLSDMVSSLSDVFTIQEPDETTTLMFPNYPQDRILHDARIGHTFHQRDYNFDPNLDADILLGQAWLNRDEDFPPDVVLPGDGQFSELIFPMPLANITGTRGVHQAILIGAASPEHFHINIKNEYLAPLERLSLDASQYFKESGLYIEAFKLPDELIYPGFPCLVYIEKSCVWERCAIVGSKPTGRKRVLIETVDYGGLHSVDPKNLYLMPKKFLDIPKQAVLVSIMGLKPNDGTKWRASAGVRVRCFSDNNYWLDFLMLESKEKISRPVENLSDGAKLESPANNNSGSNKKKRRHNLEPKTKFEVLVCDRNDEDLDLYLDEILNMEEFAIREEERSAYVETLRKQFSEALKTIPRPKNPLN